MTYLCRIRSFHSYECNIISGVKLNAALILPFRTVNVSRHDEKLCAWTVAYFYMIPSFLIFNRFVSIQIFQIIHTRETRVYRVYSVLPRGVCLESLLLGVANMTGPGFAKHSRTRIECLTCCKCTSSYRTNFYLSVTTIVQHQSNNIAP